MALGWFQPVLGKYKFLKSYFTGKEGRIDCTLLYYCVQSSDYLRCVDILNHKITPLIRLLIIQKCPMRKQTLSQEFRQNNIKSLRKLVNYHSPIVFIFIYIYLFSKRACLMTVLYFIILRSRLNKLPKFSLFSHSVNIIFCFQCKPHNSICFRTILNTLLFVCCERVLNILSFNHFYYRFFYLVSIQ